MSSQRIRPWTWIAIALALVLAIVVGVLVAVSGREDPGDGEGSLGAPSASPDASETTPASSEEAQPGVTPDVPSPEMVEGAEFDGTQWTVDCDSEHASTPVSDDRCLILGFEDYGDGSVSVGDEVEDQAPAADVDVELALDFIQEWIRYDTQEGAEARASRLAPFISDTFDAYAFPELGNEPRYEQEHDLGFRSVVTVEGAPAVSSAFAMPDGSTRVDIAVPYQATFTNDSSQATTQEQANGEAIWTVWIVGGEVDEVVEPDLIGDGSY